MAQRPRRMHKARGKPDIPKIGRGIPSARAGEPPPPELLAGIEEFNTGLYFECHETLEALWVVENDPIRYLYQGILQIGVGLYHHSRGNYPGAISLMHRGITLLQPFRPRCLDVDVERLLQDSERCYTTLVGLGPDRIGDLAAELLPRVHLVDSSRAGQGAGEREVSSG